MGKISARCLSLMVVVACVSSAVPAGADPIRVTSGHVQAGGGRLDGPWNAEALVLTAAGLSMASSLEDEVAFVQLAAVPVMAPGTLLDLSGVLHVEDDFGATLNDSFAIVAGPVGMSFRASPTPLACSSDGSECTGVAPFTFDTVLTFSPLGGGAPVTHHLFGRGTATATLTRGRFSEGGSVLYAFEASDANPIPEPATLSLFATGAITAGAGVWRRRRAGHRTP